MVFFNATFDMQKITNIILTVLRNAYLDVTVKINYMSESTVSWCKCNISYNAIWYISSYICWLLGLFLYTQSLQYKALTQGNHFNKLQRSLSQSIVDALKILIKIMQVLISCRKLLPAEI